MSFERQHSGHEIDRATTRDADTVAPGRRAATEAMNSGRGPVESGLLHRKADPDARDGDGVTADAHQHVERAATSTGSALPSELRTQFEGALGHDLGGVRVHTGAASAAAADAVGARAYATGNDIHFNHGEYDPHSTEGQRLIAHEVVHTVQQQGAAPSTQYKLEVSSAGDAHEVEADELADQMVARQPKAAAPAAVRPAGGVARKPVSSVGRGIHRWDSRQRWGFRRRADVPWCKDNPSDSWNHGPNDYVAVGSAMPPATTDAPADVAPMWAGKWPEPLNGIGSDGKAYDLPPGRTVDKANEAIDALGNVMSTVVSTHNGMGERVRDYQTAAEQVKPDGLFGPAPQGLNWAPPKDGGKADAGQLAGKQTPSGSKTSIDDAFKGDKADGISDKTVAAGQQQEVSTLLETARTKDQVVQRKVLDYRQYIRKDVGHAVLGVQDAFTKLAIKKEGEKKDDAEQKEKDLETEKKDAIELIGTCGKVIEKGSKVLEGDVSAARELILLGAEKVVTAQFEKEIKAQRDIIRTAKTKIRSLEGSLVDNAIKVAQDALTQAIENLAGMRQAVVDALRERQTAYDTAAAAAKKQAIAHGADPKEAERLQTVIMAIPRIEIVVTKLNQIVERAVVPTYDATAGLAYAVGRNGNRGIDAPAFERAIGAIKFNRDRYTAEKTKWQGRLDSAKAIENGLNVTSTQAK